MRKGADSPRRTQATLIAAIAAALCAPGCYGAREAPAEVPLRCGGCHGTDEAPAPPPGLWINGSKRETTNRGVGAHQAHLAAKNLSKPVRCDACHHVPTTVGEPGHMDGLPAEVIFSGLAIARDTKATWDGKTCAVYCHSGTQPGGAVPRPIWTKVDGSQLACTSCHGMPPSGTHPKTGAALCSSCHDKTVNAANKIIDVSLHINGQIEVLGGACNSCHGSPANNAPPVDTQGNSAETARGVGAHQAHVRPAAGHGPIDCNECHIVPSALSSPGHTDTPLPAEVNFGKLAKTGGNAPVWDSKALTCAQVYCHSLAAGSSPVPAWNKQERTTCNSCHGVPPSAHPPATLTECVNCHKTVDATGKIVKPERHVNGTVDFN